MWFHQNERDCCFLPRPHWTGSCNNISFMLVWLCDVVLWKYRVNLALRNLNLPALSLSLSLLLPQPTLQTGFPTLLMFFLDHLAVRQEIFLENIRVNSDVLIHCIKAHLTLMRLFITYLFQINQDCFK